jgi:ketosteroid isomerase-like protein
MRHGFYLAVVFLTASAIGGSLILAARQSSPPTDSGTTQAIQEVLSTQEAAWNRGDIPAFLEGYWHSPELTFSGSDGIARGYDGVSARYKRSYPDRAAMGQLTFSELEIRPLAPDAALVLGHWHLKRDSGDVGGVFTLIFRRFPVGWRIVHDHTSAQK